MKIKFCTVALALTFLIPSFLHGQKYNFVKFGLCTDVHLPTMHDSEKRLTAFINRMKLVKPDFILEMGDFGTPEKQYAYLFDIWNSFPGDKYHVIGNHEMDGGYSLAQALENLKMTSPYYSFDKNGFHFVILNGNDKKNAEAKGYKQFIGPEQVDWLKKDLAGSKHPVVVFSHQGLHFYHGPDENYGVENYQEIQKIFEDHNAKNPAGKVIASFNGHTHTDNCENINGIYYITITSMSYHWLGDNYVKIRYSEEVDKNFKWIKYTAPFKDPLYTVVEISSKGYIKIAGMKTEWVGPSPFDLGYPAEYKKYLKPGISERNLEFTLKK